MLLTGPPSSLSATNTTSSSCLPKKSTSPASYLQPPTTPNVFGKQSINSYTASHHLSWHFTCRQLCFLFHRQNIQTPSLSLASLPHHLCTHPLLLPLPPISQSSPLPQNPKSTRSCPTLQTSNVTQIRSQPGFLKNAHEFLFPQSPILSTFPSSPACFTPLSRNPLSHHCLRNQHWIKKNSRTIGQSRICLSFPK